MKRNGAHSSAQWYLEGRHKEALQRKYEKVQMYRTLIDTWESRPDADYDYIKDLKKRLRSTENQLKAMKP